MRKLLNDPQSFVDEVMAGIFLAHGDEVRPATTDHRTLVRADAPTMGRVGIVTGGGSGHLPFFLGYVGAGLCSAVAVGNVFSSPSSAQIHAASRAVDGGAGLLYLYGNYGGDVYNFDLAAELCRADGIDVETVLGTDDILSAPAAQAHTRRGVAGLVLAFKVAGAKAEQGASLAEVSRVARAAVAATRTMGVGLSPTILPAAGQPTFELGDGEMEIGVGIHGEQGPYRGPLESADAITDRFLAELDRELELTAGARVAVLVNGLGATPLEELYVIYRRAALVLQEREVVIVRRYIGEFVTSLEMAGASLSIMLVDEELETLLAEPASSPFFRQGAADPTALSVGALPVGVPATAPAGAGVALRRTGIPSALRARLMDRLPRLDACVDELRKLDAVVGDGDLGLTVGAGVAGVMEALDGLPADADDAGVLRVSAAAFASANPSTFAALVGAGVLHAAETIGEEQVDSTSVSRVLRAIADRIAELGGAQPGDKTLLDALLPIIDALEADLDPVAAAREAVERTTALQARRGRAAWQGARSIGHPDPGSVAVLRFAEALG